MPVLPATESEEPQVIEIGVRIILTIKTPKGVEVEVEAEGQAENVQSFEVVNGDLANEGEPVDEDDEPPLIVEDDPDD